MSGFTFGTPQQQTAPAAAAPGGGAPSFSFGSNISTNQNPPSLFTPQQQQTQSTGFSFGTTPAQNTNTGLNFGTQPQQPQQNLSFGTQPQQNLSFGTQPQQNLSFGTQPQQNLSFGTQPQQPNNVTTGLNFGTQPQQQNLTTGFSFGTPQPQNQLNPTTTSLNSGFTFGTPTTTTPQSSMFMTTSTNPTAPSTTAQSSLFSFKPPENTPAATNPAPTLSNLFSNQQTTTTTSSISSTISAGSAGLGGSSSISSLPPPSSSFSSSHKNEFKNILETNIPMELQEVADELLRSMKSNKVEMGEMIRTATTFKKVEKISKEIEEVRSTVQNVSNVILRQSHNCDSFRHQINQDVRDGEMAGVMQETPWGVQNESSYLGSTYFKRLASDYVTRMKFLKREIHKAEAALLTSHSSQPLTPQQLREGLRSVRDSTISVASKLKSLHERVSEEREVHFNLLRLVGGEREEGDRLKYRNNLTTNPGKVISSSNPSRLYMNFISGNNNGSNSPFTNMRSNTTPHFDNSKYGMSSFHHDLYHSSPLGPAGSPLSLKRAKN